MIVGDFGLPGNPRELSKICDVVWRYCRIIVNCYDRAKLNLNRSV